MGDSPPTLLSFVSIIRETPVFKKSGHISFLQGALTLVGADCAFKVLVCCTRKLGLLRYDQTNDGTFCVIWYSEVEQISDSCKWTGDENISN